MQSRILKISRGARGVTLHMERKKSAFTAPGSPYCDATVLAIISHRYRAPEDGKVSMVVHFHGHGGDVDQAVEKHQLREQFHDSKQNAILLVPEQHVYVRHVLPVKACEGKAEEPAAGRARLGGIASCGLPPDP